jgi:hypothetical protein
MPCKKTQTMEEMVTSAIVSSLARAVAIATPCLLASSLDPKEVNDKVIQTMLGVDATLIANGLCSYTKAAK